jgi:UrcA family protein
MLKSKLRTTGFRFVAVFGVLVSTMSIADLHCRDSGHETHAHAVLSVDDSDLDLSRQSELFMLYQRLQDAAMHLCHPDDEHRVLPVFGLADRGDCYSEMLGTALAAYDNLSLTRIHEQVLEPPIFIGLDDAG